MHNKKGHEWNLIDSPHIPVMLKKRGWQNVQKLKNYILNVAENQTLPVFYGTKQLCKVSTKLTTLFSSYFFGNFQGTDRQTDRQTDRRMDMQFFWGYHIIPHHFVLQDIKMKCKMSESSVSYNLVMAQLFYLKWHCQTAIFFLQKAQFCISK